MIALPPWLDPEAYIGFVEMRKRIKAPLTERAERMLLKRLQELKDAGHDPTACLEQSEFHSWRDVYPPKDRQITPATRKAAAETVAYLARRDEITPNPELARAARAAVRLVK